MPASDSDPKLPPMTVVTCIEQGALEIQVPLMVETLRRFGGPFAQCPVIAVSPRWAGTPLLSKTRRSLDRLGIQLIEQNVRHRYNWMGFFNKPTALLLAAPHIKTEYGLWLDGDILVARPPMALLDHPEVDVLAAVEEMGPVSTGPESPYDSFWARLAQVNGLTIDGLPWVTRPFSREKIRIYFNSGVFRYRMGVGLEQGYLDACEALLDARIVPDQDRSIFLHEQISFGLAIPRRKLSFRELDFMNNFQVEEVYESTCPISRYPEVTLFHYHRGLWNSYRTKLIENLRGPFPELAELVESYPEPRRNVVSKVRKLPGRMLSEWRKRKMSRFTAGCTPV